MQPNPLLLLQRQVTQWREQARRGTLHGSLSSDCTPWAMAVGPGFVLPYRATLSYLGTYIFVTESASKVLILAQLDLSLTHLSEPKKG